MLNFIRLMAVGLILTGCTSTKTPTQKPPGFLPNYSLLKAVPSPDGTQIYIYKDPKVKRSDYHAMIIESVSLYQQATKNVTNQEIESARIGIDNGITKIVSKKINITTTPGAGVAKMSVAITGAELEGDGFKLRYLIPISAAIKLATMATDTDNKKPILVVEIKIVDSQSGKLLKEIVTTINGDKFRFGNNADKFKQLAITWVHEALKYSDTQ